jgi:hypothetical protein
MRPSHLRSPRGAEAYSTSGYRDTASLLFIVSVHIGLIRRRGVTPPPGAEELEVPEDEPGHPAGVS